MFTNFDKVGMSYRKECLRFYCNQVGCDIFSHTVCMLILCTKRKLAPYFSRPSMSVYDVPCLVATSVTIQEQWLCITLCRRMILGLEFHEFDKIRPDKRNLFDTSIGNYFPEVLLHQTAIAI